MPTEDHKVAEAIIRLLDAKTQNKRQEMEALSMPILDRSPEYNHRKFQVEVEYWQLKNTTDEIRTLAAAAGLVLPAESGDAVKNPSVANPASRNETADASA